MISSKDTLLQKISDVAKLQRELITYVENTNNPIDDRWAVFTASNHILPKTVIGIDELNSNGIYGWSFAQMSTDATDCDFESRFLIESTAKKYGYLTNIHEHLDELKLKLMECLFTHIRSHTSSYIPDDGQLDRANEVGDNEEDYEDDNNDIDDNEDSEDGDDDDK